MKSSSKLFGIIFSGFLMLAVSGCVEMDMGDPDAEWDEAALEAEWEAALEVEWDEALEAEGEAEAVQAKDVTTEDDATDCLNPEGWPDPFACGN